MHYIILLFITLFVYDCNALDVKLSKSTCCGPSTSLNSKCEGKAPNNFDWRTAFAGGMAGGVTNLILFPFDTLKTMRQSDKRLNNMLDAFVKLRGRGIRQAYSGVIPSVVGSVPSSAIYFGTYEFAKKVLNRAVESNLFNTSVTFLPRPTIHMLAAISGNVLSSIIFVPKDAVKIRIQAIRTGSVTITGSSAAAMTSAVTTVSSGEALASTGLLSKADPASIMNVIKSIYTEKGLYGFYTTFGPTLARNIPSAVVRFTVYEELRAIFLEQRKKRTLRQSQAKSKFESRTKIEMQLNNRLGLELTDLLLYIMAGSTASAFASACCTPLDVVKTRISIGVVAPGTPLTKALASIYKEEGLHGLFAGINSRILGSSLFGGIGFASFESFKALLGVDSDSSRSISTIDCKCRSCNRV
jgi:hypothetical protein